MTDEMVAQRLAERRICEEQHQHLRVRHTGFGWTGTRCSRCGFMFFGQWNPEVVAQAAAAERLNF